MASRCFTFANTKPSSDAGILDVSTAKIAQLPPEIINNSTSLGEYQPGIHHTIFPRSLTNVYPTKALFNLSFNPLSGSLPSNFTSTVLGEYIDRRVDLCCVMNLTHYVV